jgi:hypothetical protein
MWTDKKTLATPDALFGEELDLRFGTDRLWVVAPETMQGTALQEHSGPNARPIVYRKALDVEDNACHTTLLHIKRQFQMASTNSISPMRQV